ncbi:MAG: hypothetical protein KC431_16745 [Myxococcales bacterium]|nr:hypothetical protein [Myxococcales bacterium]MCA9699174.1 hypothetical protein [Myxococcales bacterium]
MVVVNQYQVEVRGDAGADNVRARILLIGEGGNRSALGRIHFHDTGTQLPGDSFENNVVDMHVPMDAFAGILALLQHDKPIKIGFYSGFGVLRTGEWEPVGEGQER